MSLGHRRSRRRRELPAVERLGDRRPDGLGSLFSVEWTVLSINVPRVDAVAVHVSSDRSGSDVREVIEDTVANLSGFELLETGDTKIRLTNLIDAENVDIRKSTLRLRLVMLGMHRDAVSAILTDDETLARRVIDRDNEADKLFAMVTRHFRRALTNLHEVEKLEYTRDELFEYYYVSRQFERSPITPRRSLASPSVPRSRYRRISRIGSIRWPRVPGKSSTLPRA